MSAPRINTFSQHYRRKYGAMVGKIPLDVGVVCPNRAKGGCIYCRAQSFTPLHLDKKDSIPVQMVKGKKMLSGRKFRYVFGYFQQETCTALQLETLQENISDVLEDTDCVGVIISTRPDYVENKLLDYLESKCEAMGKECLIELGLQSIHDKSLEYLNRNHNYQDFLETALRIKQRQSLQLGTHLILGIPGETQKQMLQSVESVCELGVDALKFHHLQVIKKTRLYEMHQENPIDVFSEEKYLELLSDLLPHIPHRVVIHRLWSTSHPEVLLAPRWDLYAHELSVRLEALLEKRELFQGKFVQ